jgi:histidine triad (HIT) family protein
MASDPHCLFCRIGRGEIPATLVYHAPDVVAIRDISPQAPQHILVLPRAHVASLNDVTDPALVGRLALVAAEIARREGFADQGYRTVINTRVDGGQTVGHLHLHLLGGRRMLWPPG